MSSSTEIFVANIAFNSLENSLQDFVEQHVGPVQSIKIVMDRETGRSRGFGFISFTNPSDLHKAVQELNGLEFEGRALSVRLAEPKQERGPRPQGGGYRGGNGGGNGGGYGGGRGSNRRDDRSRDFSRDRRDRRDY